MSQNSWFENGIGRITLSVAIIIGSTAVWGGVEYFLAVYDIHSFHTLVRWLFPSDIGWHIVQLPWYLFSQISVIGIGFIIVEPIGIIIGAVDGISLTLLLILQKKINYGSLVCIVYSFFCLLILNVAICYLYYLRGEWGRTDTFLNTYGSLPLVLSPVGSLYFSIGYKSHRFKKWIKATILIGILILIFSGLFSSRPVWAP